jgi:hypothetical protein
MKECCDKWLLKVQPNKKVEGRHVERLQCPDCQTWHEVEFACVGSLGSDELECVAVGVL